MRIAGVGKVVFAATLIGLGVLGLVGGGFSPIWNGVPKNLPLREVLAVVSSVVALACGLGLLWRRTSTVAARVLLAFLLMWLLIFKGRIIALAPITAVSWEETGETAVIASAAWVLYAAFANDWDGKRLRLIIGDTGLRIARTLFGLAMIAFGVAHLAYVKFTASLIPSWIPWHVPWVYLTGLAYIAAGLAVASGILGRLAASLALLQIGLFTLLVWIPQVVAGSRVPDVWSETIVSWTLTAAALVVAESYRGTRWLAARAR